MDLKEVFSGEKTGEKFRLFFDILTQNNKKYNLTSVLDEKDAYIKHFCDSIIPEELFFKGANVVEIGSGGGFPSIPLKIVRDDLSFTLIESTGKKCEHLKEVVDKLNLTNVEVKNIRAEDGARTVLRENFDCAVARAVARLNTLCEYCIPFIKVGGRFIAYKSCDEDELKESGNAIKTLGARLESVFYYELPEGAGKRCAYVIKKVEKTPTKYPRGQGKERKKPL